MAATVTLLYFGQSVGGTYTTITGSLTNTLLAGDVLVAMQVALTVAAASDPTDNNGTWTKQVAEYNAKGGSGQTYGGFYTQLAPAAGSHVVTPQVIAGGSDGLFYLVRVRGMTTPTIRTGQKKTQLTSATTFSVATAAAATAGDLVFGVRTHENSVAINPATFSAKPPWTTDFGDYLNGGVNLPTNAGYYVSAGGTETLSWTNIDTTITDTSGAVLVLFDAAPSFITGTVAKTLGSLTSSSAGVLPIQGSLSKTLGALTASATGTGASFITGSLGITLGTLTAASAAVLPVVGTLAKTLGALTLASTATIHGPGPTVTPLYFGQSVGAGYNTITGSLTNTLAAGDVLIGIQLALTSPAATDPTDTNGAWTKQAASFTPRTTNFTTYGGFYTQLAAAAGVHVVTPEAIVGGNDGLFYLVKISGMTTPTVRAIGQNKEQQTAATTFSIATTGAATAGDLVFGVRCHENSVVINPATFSAKPSWAVDFGTWLDGGVNLPANAGYYTSVGGIETLSWTNIDTNITDTSGAVLVLFDAAPTFITGTLATTLGALTAASVAVLPIQGSLAATLGALTASATGTGATLITGSLGVTLGALTAASASTLPIQATLARTLGTLTSVSAGVLPIQGALAKTLGALTSNSVATLPIAGTVAATLGSLTAVGSSTVVIQGALAATLGALTASGAGTLPIVATVAATLGALTVSASGTSGLNIAGTLAVTLGALTSSSASTLLNTGAVAVTLGALTANAAASTSRTGSLAVTLGSLTAVGAAALPIQASLAVTLGALTVSAAGGGPDAITGTVAATLGALTATAASVLPIVGTVAVTLGALTTNSVGATTIVGTAFITLGVLTCSTVALDPGVDIDIPASYAYVKSIRGELRATFQLSAKKG